MNQYYRIDDKTIARYFKKNLIKIQNKMYTLAQKQANKSYLIVFLNKHYIFYHMDTIEKFIELYNQGFGDKEMLEKLKEFEVNTRAEVKIILDTLLKLDRLKDRQISVKERRYKQRFENA
jgi:CMP-2-keto-3-deoxyoctulosonic acid synthetase